LVCEAKNGSIPAIVFNNPSDDENPVSFDNWRVTPVEQVVWSNIFIELYR
jgi:hypothetical protein